MARMHHTLLIHRTVLAISFPAMQYVLKFDKNVYSVSAAKSAANKMSNLYATEISVIGNEIICQFTSNETYDSSVIDNHKSEFKKILLDEDLRESIGEKTEDMRNIILAYAFSNLD